MGANTTFLAEANTRTSGEATDATEGQPPPRVGEYYHWVRCMVLIVYAGHCNLRVAWVEFLRTRPATPQNRSQAIAAGHMYIDLRSRESNPAATTNTALLLGGAIIVTARRNVSAGWAEISKHRR